MMSAIGMGISKSILQAGFLGLAIAAASAFGHNHSSGKPVAAGSVSEHGAYVVRAWPEFEGVDLSTTRVARNVYMIQRPGGGGNIGVYVGERGVLLVDSLYPALGARVISEVEKITDKKILYVVNTHIHIDHIGGNAALAENGATILAHESVRKRMLKPLRWPRHHGSLGPMPEPESRPVITFTDGMNFHFDHEEIRVFLAPEAHTDGDVFVYFTQSNVLHLGDVFRTTSYPVVDVYNGGSVEGTIRALDQAIGISDADTKIIPGHGLRIARRKDLVEFRDMIVAIRNRISEMIEEGMVLDVVMERRPTAEYDAKWGQEAGWTAVDFVPIVFHELGGDIRYRDNP